MSREYAKRSRGGGGNLPLIIAIVGTVIVIAVIVYFLVGNGGTGPFGGATDTPAPAPATYTPVSNTATPGPTLAPVTAEPTMEIVLPAESPSAVIAPATATPAPAKVFLDCRISASSLNVREGPSLDYGTIGKVRYGESYKVFDETTKFVKIQLSTGVYGWIWEGYTVRGSETLPPKPTSAPKPSWLSSATVSGSTLTVKFSKGVYGNKEHTVSLGTADFTVKEGSSAKSFSLTHTAGSDTATLVVSGTSGGALTVSITGDTIFDINGDVSPAGSKTTGTTTDTTAPTVSFSNSGAVVTVTFSEDAYSTNAGSGALEVADFDVSANKGTISHAVSHTAGSKTATITITYGGLSSGDTASTAVTLYSSSAYDASGNACASSTTNFTYTAP